MAFKSIIGNWILAGSVIGAFAYLSETVGTSSSVPVASETSTIAPELVQPPLNRVILSSESDEEDSDPETPAPTPLQIRLPSIELDQPLPPTTVADPFPDDLSLCALITISNAPAVDADRNISGYRKYVGVNGINIAMAPIERGCFSSGFGLRGQNLHKGVDYHNQNHVKIFAAAAGVMREKEYRNDYGNMIVIDHGEGVFTRYAHLHSFADSVEIGDTVSSGAIIGLMGNTAGYPIPVHLHYEVLVGEWAEQAGSFALTPVNVFARLSDN